MTASAVPQQIMLLDDEPSVLLALKLLLEAIGYRVFDFPAAVDALAFLKEGKACDLCICDLRMPSMDGLQVLEAMKKIRPALPVILMSGHATETEMERARELGVSGFLSKPFSPDQLKEAMDDISVPANSRNNDQKQ